MYLYDENRIIKYIEHHIEEYALRLIQREKLSKSHKDTIDKKIEDTVSWANDVQIYIEKFDRNIAKYSKKYYNDYNSSRHIDAEYRKTFNYNGIDAFARHQYTNYHELLGLLFRRIGCGDAYIIIKKRINSEIKKQLTNINILVEHYPDGIDLETYDKE